MDIIKINFGPGQLANSNLSPFKVPVSVWENVNTFLNAVANVDGDTADWIDNGLTEIGDNTFSFYSLQQMAAKWQSTNYQDLKTMTQQVHDFGAKAVPASILQMQQVSPKFKGGTYSKGDVNAFTDAVNQLIIAANQVSIASQNLKIDLQQLTTEMSGGTQFIKAVNWVKNKFDAKNYTQTNQEAQNLVNTMNQFENNFSWNNLNTCFECFTFVNGTLGTLNSELNNGMSQIQKISYSNNPFEVDGNFNVVESDWSQVANDAQSFLSSLPA
ncbi:MAG: hypothetical protein KDC34_17165 [Saprospiraceae bacterium]|nr:hypothetical protein [Saprospiraceae bacterium]